MKNSLSPPAEQNKKIIPCPKCHTVNVWQNFISGVPNRKHWFISCSCKSNKKYVHCKRFDTAVNCFNRLTKKEC